MQALTPNDHFIHSARVYYEDTDAGGIVYHANYLCFMERSRTEWLRTLGFEQDDLMEQNVAFVVRDLSINYKRPARFNDMLSISCQVVELKSASILFEQTISNAAKQLLVSAKVKVVCVNIEAMTPTAIPNTILEEITRAY